MVYIYIAAIRYSDDLGIVFFWGLPLYHMLKSMFGLGLKMGIANPCNTIPE